MKKIILSFLIFSVVGVSAQTIIKDPLFNANGTGTSGSSVFDTEIQPDGKILVGGGFITYNGVTVNGIVRLNTDGSIDDTFDTGVGALGGVVRSIKVQPDGKILIGGNFGNFNYNYHKGIVRLNSDGSFDDTFSVNFIEPQSYPPDVLDIEIAEDGNIYLAGDFIAGLNDLGARCVCRINAEGDFDSSFLPSFGEYDTVYSLTLAPDGDVYASGFFFYGVKAGLVKLNSDGTKDNAFTAGYTAYGTIEQTCILPDGGVLIGGLFKEDFSSNIFYTLGKLNSDGTFNAEFNVVQAPALNTNTNVVHDICLHNGNAIIAGNGLSYISESESDELFMIDMQGNVLPEFNTGNGFGFTNGNPSSVFSVTVQSDAKLLVGGRFNNYNSTSVSGLTRLLGLVLSTPSQVKESGLNVYYANGTNIQSVDQDIVAVEVYDITGKLVGSHIASGSVVRFDQNKSGIGFAKVLLANGQYYTLKIAL